METMYEFTVYEDIGIKLLLQAEIKFIKSKTWK